MSHLCIIWLRRVEGLLQYRDRVKRLFGQSSRVPGWYPEIEADPSRTVDRMTRSLLQARSRAFNILYASERARALHSTQATFSIQASDPGLLGLASGLNLFALVLLVLRLALALFYHLRLSH